MLITCVTTVGPNACCYSPPHGICETANDVIVYVLPFNKEGMSHVIDIVDLMIIAYPTPKLVPHVFYGVLVGRNRRPRQDVDAVLSQKLCRNTSCVGPRVVLLQNHSRTPILHKWEEIVPQDVHIPYCIKVARRAVTVAGVKRLRKCVNVMKRSSLRDVARGLPDLCLSVTDPVVAYRVVRL